MKDDGDFLGAARGFIEGCLGVFIFSEIVSEGGFDFVLDFVLDVWGEWPSFVMGMNGRGGIGLRPNWWVSA